MPPGYWLAAHRARRERRITAGALQFLYALARLARARGDGVSLTLGERVLARILGEHRSTIQRHKSALERAGLITRTRVWARIPNTPAREAWFWEETVSLTLTCESVRGLKTGPRAADSKQVRRRGPISSPSLIGRKPETTSPEKEETAAAAPKDGGPPRPGAAVEESKTQAVEGEHAPSAAPANAPPQTDDAKDAEAAARYRDFARRWAEFMRTKGTKGQEGGPCQP